MCCGCGRGLGREQPDADMDPKALYHVNACLSMIDELVKSGCAPRCVPSASATRTDGFTYHRSALDPQPAGLRKGFGPL